METKRLAEIKKGDLFYTAKEYEKYGDNEKYLRIKDEYDRSTKKWYCPRFTFDALGSGKSFKGDTLVVII